MTINLPCRWCGALHGLLCPAVKAVEFDEAGQTIIRVEFFSAAEMGRAPEPPDDDYPKKGGQT